MRSVRALILGFALLAGCKPDPFRPDAGPPWWKPAPGEYADWDIQLAEAPFDISAARAMYVIDLWDAVPAGTTLDYGDGAPLTVTAGAHATAIADLHARTPPAMVVCRVSTGAIRLDDPDAVKFRGHENPPDRPTALAPDAVIGWSTPYGPSERHINIHEERRAEVAPLIGKRIELAQKIGCDAIAAANNDSIALQAEPLTDHGFGTLEDFEYVSWATELTARAHDFPISMGLADGTKVQLLVDNISGRFDFLIEERCGERKECDQTKPFTSKNKAVFEIEYDLEEDGQTMTDVTTACDELANVGSIDAIFKTAKLDSSSYMRCP